MRLVNWHARHAPCRRANVAARRRSPHRRRALAVVAPGAVRGCRRRRLAYRYRRCAPSQRVSETTDIDDDSRPARPARRELVHQIRWHPRDRRGGVGAVAHRFRPGLPPARRAVRSWLRFRSSSWVELTRGPIHPLLGAVLEKEFVMTMTMNCGMWLILFGLIVPQARIDAATMVPSATTFSTAC